jgi:hypothetical protein
MEDFKSIKIELDFADENGNRVKKQQTIKVNTPSLKDKSTFSWHYHIKSVYTLSFTIQIPEFIHSYLIGKCVPSTRSDQTKDYKEDFAKSINRTSIEQLTEMWCELISDYVWLKKMEQADLKKVIFYQFSNKYGNYKSYWNGTEFGELSELGYKYSIGYVSETEKKQIRYNNQKLSISSSNDKEFYNLKFVEWTEERELFFINIQKSFEVITDKINKFESSITEETINGLIANSPLQLTN